MVEKEYKLILLAIVLIFSVSFSLNFISSTYNQGGANCFENTGNYTGCIALNSSCIWKMNNQTIPQQPFCMINSTNYNSNNMIYINPIIGWRNHSILTSSSIANAGCCEMKMSGGNSMGCSAFNGNMTGCQNSSLYGVIGCSWKSNNMNQNSFCYLKQVGDWGPNGQITNINDVGCCEMPGCWAFSGNQTPTNNCTTALNGVCSYVSACSNAGGCCSPKSCSEINDETQCNQLASLGNPCLWNGSACRMPGSGGYNMYNTSDSCLTMGGWWNSSGACKMPEFGGFAGGGGGFMFASEARCWFADNRQSVCQNVSGCVYCSNSTNQLNNASSGCYNMRTGLCQGHEPRNTNYNGTDYVTVTDINQSSMTCGDLRAQQICTCGPLPNCKWSNSSTTNGAYCESGLKSNDDKQSCSPPVKFCEDTSSKNNQTLCNQLSSDYMMPCKWDNSTIPNKNCTFNNIAVFGFGTAMSNIDYNSVNSEISCLASGGTWKTEYYEDSDGSFKQDSWCEKGALFSFSSGQAFANKGNCNSDCWACEFNATGSGWRNSSDSVLQGQIKAETACLGSAKGICKWKNDTTSPNGLGYCDYPKEMSFGGAQDCNTDCKACEFIGTSSAQSSQACSASPAGCIWVNNTNSMLSVNGKTGYCIASSKKSCLTECFSCYSQSECSNSTQYHPSMNCSWDSDYSLCKPSGFIGEICFNGKDDDNDGKADCTDSDCTYDTFCGGGSIGTGNTATDCKKKNITDCRVTISSGGQNCTLVTSTFGGSSYCDYPGTDCWMYDTNITACTKTLRGCIYRNATAGYPEGSTGPQISSKSFSGFCEMNKTISSICYNSTNMGDSTLCNVYTNGNCTWINDSYSFNGGRCEFKPFVICGSKINSSSCNSQLSFCSWRNDSFSPTGGFCEIKGMSLDSASCKGIWQWKGSMCEPEAFGGMEMGGMGTGGFGGGFGCHMNDGNYTGCLIQNMSCSWNNFTMGIVSQGICNEKGAQMMFASMDMSPPKILGNDPADVSPSEIDIAEFGIKDTTNSLSFGIVVKNITNASVCRGYYIGGGFGNQPILGAGNATTKFYWFLDTNKNTADGCTATMQNGSPLTGFEFLMKYTVYVNNGTVSETKTFSKCSSGNWSLTNVPLTSNRQFMCGMSMPGRIGGVMMIIDKENLESFSSYNKTTPMRVFVSSADNDSYNENNPKDSASAGYYTSGTADFKFVDCSNPDTKDEKCKHFQKFGFNIFEDCKNGIDDDSDGFSDCSDPKCLFTPMCSSGTAFAFTSNPDDHESPGVVFSQVDTLYDGAFVKFDSNEPANGTLDFYGNDSTCLSINATINDLGDPSVTFDNYKPFHLVGVDSTSLGYSLTNNTKYFYKTSICDSSGNCATSSCQNFTTKNSIKNFIFKMNLPPGYNVSIPAFNYNGNFTKQAPGSNSWYEIGVKTNATVGRNINVTVNCGTQSLTFVGVDILKPKSIDLNGAFICDSTSANKVLGMNSSSKSWSQAITDLGMGGQSDYLKLSFQTDYSAGNTINWCNDALSNCSSVNSYTSCVNGGSGKTDCKIPTSLGFSAYQLVVPGGSSTSSSSSSSGGGSSGGAITKKNVTSNKTISSSSSSTSSSSSSSSSTSAGGGDISSRDTGLTDLGGVSSKSKIWKVAIISIIGLVIVGIITYIGKRKKRYYEFGF